ncbi:MAG: hypothetical protein HY078_16635 [Elusimicrobia bacterium]|nr:hypothetical protein [Elusimicrobiota bacterium]
MKRIAMSFAAVALMGPAAWSLAAVESMPQQLTFDVAYMAAAQLPKSESVGFAYTDLRGPNCAAIPTGDIPEYGAERCPGFRRYGMIVEYGDQRNSITVVAPNGKKFPLDFWSELTVAPSAIGQKAEWRFRRVPTSSAPHALIVRLDFPATGDPELRHLRKSYLVVVKIAADNVCISDLIAPSNDQNEKARASADSAAQRGCYQKP